MKAIYLLIFLSTGLHSHLMGQFLKTEGDKIVLESGEEFLLRGMGLGGWMVQEGYMLQTAEFANPQHQIRAHIQELIGEERTQEFYDAWLANHMTEADVIALKNWGFNSVRLPMHYNLFTLPIQEEPVEGEHTWLDKGFELTDSLLTWCATHEMYIVLDLHAAPGGQGYDQGISDYNPDLPSLWESDLNQEKTIALWRRIAERYKNEAWIAGYDLINEPNWNLANGVLRSLYTRITDAIREVDQDHILFIEGNWFANDFTGLTPPWDDNLVYSPHKYWSFNDQASIQWVLDMREEHNVPLYLGESGENSNVWFKDAIQLLEENNIGWAWWPLKKVESIAGPLSVEKTTAYSNLLDYWKGFGTQPSSDEVFATLMELTEKLRFENCKLQADVIDAMFRQQSDDELLPFKSNEIPGIVYATDFDFGTNGIAYQDNEIANYQVSTGNYTSWNNGWQYRNDGVDIELCEDNVNANGYNIAWTDAGEWMKYTVNAANPGIYDLHLRVASSSGNGGVFFDVNDARASEEYPIPSTGDFQNWQTMVVPGIFLEEGTQTITCHIAEEGFNLSSFDFKYEGNATQLAFKANRAITLNPTAIQLDLNKSLATGNSFNPADFTVFIDGSAKEVAEVTMSVQSNRMLILNVNEILRSDQQIRLSYSGTNILSTDQTLLTTFEQIWVQNNLAPVHYIPGTIQAEDYARAEGVGLEETTDLGQGQNIGFLDPGDYLEYEVNVDQPGPYMIKYRVASEHTAGKLRLSLIDLNGQTEIIDEPVFPITGGWQVWQDLETTADMEPGAYTLRIDILEAPFNLNWIEFESQFVEVPPVLGINVFPNPVSSHLSIEANFSIPHQLSYQLFEASGRLVRSRTFEFSDSVNEMLNLSEYADGFYILKIVLEDGTEETFKLVKLFY